MGRERIFGEYREICHNLLLTMNDTDAVSDPVAHATTRENLNLYTAISNLSEDVAVVMIANKVLNMSDREIAIELGLHKSIVERRLRQGEFGLRKLYNKEEDNNFDARR